MFAQSLVLFLSQGSRSPLKLAESLPYAPPANVVGGDLFAGRPETVEMNG